MSAANEAIRRAKGPGPWTPGPWDARGQEADDEPARVHASAGGEWVADVFSNTNARLIALAPEMAELLARIAVGSHAALFPEVDALLARARGEA